MKLPRKGKDFNKAIEAIRPRHDGAGRVYCGRRAMTATRPWVDAFADEMEAKLACNRHKGDRAGWRNCTTAWLLKQLLAEVGELVEVHGGKMPYHGGKEARRAAIRSECADIANYAMMIADVAGGLRSKGGER